MESNHRPTDSPPITEAAYYNAVALALQGDYSSIKKARKSLSDWKSTYENLGQERLFEPPIPDPLKEYEALLAAGVQLILREDTCYPARLREIPHAPFGIYIRRAIAKNFENGLALSIVGTRRATADGKRAAREFAQKLSASGFTIVSGLAFGIDAAAHEGALSARRDGLPTGSTVAVLAGGLDSVYPRSHLRLAEEILSHGGALVSEYPLGEPPYSYRFIERNRIVSGLSRGTLVIEAPENSGALATARFAFEQNRDLFVVPGAITHPLFKGSHALIRQGAELVTCPEEILTAYGMTHGGENTLLPFAQSREETLILKALQDASTPLDVDKIIEAAKLEPRIVNRTLSFLLLSNAIKETGAGYTI